MDELRGELLNDIIDLEIAAQNLPKGLSYRFAKLDPTIKDALSHIQTKTSSILSDLLSYCNNGNIIKEFEFENCTKKTFNKLLNPQDFDFMKSKPKTFLEQDPPQTKIVGDVKFIFCKSIAKPAKFSPEIVIPSSLPILTSFPNISMPDPPNLDPGKISYISTLDQLSQSLTNIVQAFSSNPFFVSFEYHRIRTYRPFPCFCSVVASDYSVLVIDILSLRDQLQPLFDFLTDSNIIKIFYNASLDLPILAETLSIFPAPIFDISLLNSSSIPIEDILQSYGFLKQKYIIDWRIRPVNSEILAVAASSAYYLPYITTKAIKDISKNPDEVSHVLERLSLYGHPSDVPFWTTPFQYTEEMASIEAQAIIHKFGELDEIGTRILQDLLLWRNGVGIMEDECPNFIMTDQRAWKISSEKPQSGDELNETLQGLMTPRISSLKYEILIMIKKASGVQTVAEQFKFK